MVWHENANLHDRQKREDRLGKTALIVDDSRSARVVLSRMLEAHEIDVDTAESAEEALLYLSDHRPDVIFMDHLMPGMDGFEAVSAIKNNPDTATIPIMMYTSQEGELYVGQARALGAVGVLPKQVEPVEVSKVLESLRVIGNKPERRVHEDGSRANDDSGDYPSLEKFDQDLRVLIRDLFDQQRAVIRRDLLDSYESIATRVADEIRAAEPQKDEPDDQEISTAGELSGLLQIATAVLAVIALIFAWLYWQREQSWVTLQQQNAALQRLLEDQQAFDTEGAIQIQEQLDEYQQSFADAYEVALRSLEWAANQSSTYAYGELPLGDERLEILETMTDNLTTINFSGTVRLETHVGDFCLSASGREGFELAFADLPAVQCDRIGVDPVTAYEIGLRQSVAFANFLRVTNARTDGRIRFEIVSLGNTAPVLPYPADASGISASLWNDIAADNNRVEVSIVDDRF
jgi:CheY-like chemotaxis protein